jgi:hypothetical protein
MAAAGDGVGGGKERLLEHRQAPEKAGDIIEVPPSAAEAGLLGHLLSYKLNGLKGVLRKRTGGP